MIQNQMSFVNTQHHPLTTTDKETHIYRKIFNTKVRIRVRVGFRLRVELVLGLARKGLRLDQDYRWVQDQGWH